MHWERTGADSQLIISTGWIGC